MSKRYLTVTELPDDEPIKQSPLMVGCSARRMETRCKSHLPESRMGNTTLTWALTLSVLKHMGLSPTVVSIPVLVTAEAGDLPVAERLVTVLAQSHIGQIGYNIVEGGGQHDASGLDDDEDRLIDLLFHVHIEGGWPEKQTKAALNELRYRQELDDEVTRTNKAELAALTAYEAELDSLGGPWLDLRIGCNSLERSYQDVVKGLERMSLELDSVEETIKGAILIQEAVVAIKRAALAVLNVAGVDDAGVD
ncbi:hypothetical protein QBC39DRAFT_133502 [Podospora conica]|nr:hypothetical protein QBC39DRAFT_133502 [Schizothecium conicum]